MSFDTMTTRKVPHHGEENAKKHQRFGGSHDIFGVPNDDTASFDELNNDCIIQILSYLPTEDINSVATCSQSCREARRTESLDQTRTGTIVLTKNSSLE